MFTTVRSQSDFYKKSKELDKDFERIILSDNLWGNLVNKIVESETQLLPTQKQSFRTALYNERKYILTEASQNQSFDVAKVQKIVLPLVRRFWPKLIQNEIVSTQPLTAPTGFIRKLIVHYQNTELPGIVPASEAQIPQSEITLETAANPGGFTQTNFVSSGMETPIQLGSVEVRIDVEATGQQGGNNVKTPVQVAARDDGHGKLHGTFKTYEEVGGSWVEITSDVYGTIDYKTGVGVVFIANAEAALKGRGDLNLHYSKDWQGAENADFANKEVTFDIQQDTIIATERKLRTSWKPEFAEDLSAIDGIDAQQELYDNVQNIIAQEINSQVLRELYNGQAEENRKIWDKEQPNNTAGLGFYGTRKEWYETLMIAINDLQAVVASRTNFAEPNILVAHPTAFAILRNALQSYSAGSIKPLSDDQVTVGYKKYDINAGQYTVYTSNLVEQNKILALFKGGRIEESGYVYAPYVPLTAIPWTDNTGVMGITFHTRYGTKLYRPDWFGILEIQNFSS